MEDFEENQRREQCHDAKIDLFAEDRQRQTGLGDGVSHILVQNLEYKIHMTVE